MSQYIRNNKAKAVFFAAGLALLSTVFLDGKYLEALLSRSAFYCMLLLFLAWGAALASFAAGRKDKLAFFFSLNKWGFIFSLVLTAALFLALKPGFRILSDETNLLAVSKSMLSERRVDNVTIAKWYYFNQQPELRERDKRPYAYPFSEFLLHAVTGYRPANALAVNFIWTCLLFCSIFAFFRGLYGPGPALAALLLTASQPVLGLSATSGGMDLMAAAFLFFSFLALREYLRSGDRDAFVLLWATLLMLANVRYEGPLFMAAFAAGLLLARKIKAEGLASWQFALTPLIMLPAVWQRFCLTINYENKSSEAVFSAANFLKNAGTFLKMQVVPDFFYPYAVPVGIAGLAAGCYYLYGMCFHNRPEAREDRTLARISVFVLAVYGLLTFSYYSGNASLQASARLLLPALLALSLLAAWLLAKLFGGRPVPLVLAATAVFLVYAPLAAENRFYNCLFQGREYRHERRFLKELGDNNILVIAERPGQFTVLDYGAVDFAYARANSKQLLNELSRHLYSKMIVFQEIEYLDGKPAGASALGPEYALVTLEERQNTSDSFIRISEVRPPAGAR